MNGKTVFGCAIRYNDLTRHASLLGLTHEAGRVRSNGNDWIIREKKRYDEHDLVAAGKDHDFATKLLVASTS